jgi:cell division protein FtsB
MLAIKENRQYTITEVDVQSFVSDGYDVYDDNGNLVAYGVGKTVPFDKYAKLMAQNEKLQDEIIELREQVKALEKKGAKKG